MIIEQEQKHEEQQEEDIAQLTEVIVPDAIVEAAIETESELEQTIVA
jgi:hypothetical protein